MWLRYEYTRLEQVARNQIFYWQPIGEDGAGSIETSIKRGRRFL